MTRVDRPFLEKPKACEILGRRDKIVARFEREVRKRGEADVFPFRPGARPDAGQPPATK